MNTVHQPNSELSLIDDFWYVNISWLDVSVAEHAFRHIAAEKKRSALSWLPLKGLDFVRDDWGPHIAHCRPPFEKRAIPVYSCRWAGGGSQGEQVRVFPVRYNEVVNFIGSERYEEALASVGLWDLASLLEGPWVL